MVHLKVYSVPFCIHFSSDRSSVLFLFELCVLWSSDPSSLDYWYFSPEQDGCGFCIYSHLIMHLNVSVLLTLMVLVHS